LLLNLTTIEGSKQRFVHSPQAGDHRHRSSLCTHWQWSLLSQGLGDSTTMLLCVMQAAEEQQAYAAACLHA
jgi:hypothetical protein